MKKEERRKFRNSFRKEVWALSKNNNKARILMKHIKLLRLLLSIEKSIYLALQSTIFTTIR
jgi:hypothetical protein